MRFGSVRRAGRRGVFLSALVVVIVCAMGAASPVQAVPFSDIFVIGDSGVDSGNWNGDPAIQAELGLPTDPLPPTIYTQGRWSNNFVWSDLFAQHFQGDVLTPSSLGGTNYAYGSAVTGGNKRLDSPQAIPTMLEQTQQLLTDFAGVLDPDALYIVSGGSNNFGIHNAGMTDAEIALAVIADLNSILGQLSAAGARQFLVSTPVPFDDTTVVPGLIGDITFFDRDPVVAQILADPGAFGITELERSCFIIDTSGPVPVPRTYDPSIPASDWDPVADGYPLIGTCAAPNTHFRLDGVHATEPVQIALADAAIGLFAIPAPGMAGLLGLTALGLIASRRRRALGSL